MDQGTVLRERQREREREENDSRYIVQESGDSYVAFATCH
jgi:hypothetical protein